MRTRQHCHPTPGRARPSGLQPPTAQILGETSRIESARLDEDDWARGRSRLGALRPSTLRVEAPQVPQALAAKPLYAGPDAAGATVAPAPWPEGLQSPVLVGEPVLLKGAGPLLDGHLWMPLGDAERRGIDADTVRIFRWQPAARRFQRVLHAGTRQSRWAWARVCVPGLYVTIGLPRDPVVGRLLKAALALSDLAGPDEARHAKLLQDIGSIVARAQDDHTLLQQPSPPARPANPDLPAADPGDVPMDRGAATATLGMPVRDALLQLLGSGEIPEPVPTWSFVGPRNLAGCTWSVVIDPFVEDTIYACTADGGAWRLDGADAHPDAPWVPLSDRMPLLRTQVLAVAPSAPGVLYLQMRDQRLYRSGNRGGRWTLTGAMPLGLGTRLLVDPRNASRVYLASTTGFWRSEDAGRTWETGNPLWSGLVTDLAIDPARPDLLYIAVPGQGLLHSFDRGDSWAPVAGLPAEAGASGAKLRIALGLSGPADRRRIVVKAGQQVWLGQHGYAGSFERFGPPLGGLRPGLYHGDLSADVGQGGWSDCIAIDPHDEDLVLGGLDMLYRRRASSGDADWEVAVRYVTPYAEGHPDYHDIVFDPARPGVVYVANDGGVYRSDDHGTTWRGLNEGLHTLQIWSRTGTAAGVLMCGAYHHGVVAAPNLRSDQDWVGTDGGSWEFSSVLGDPQRLPATFYVWNAATDAAQNVARRMVRRVPPGTAVSVATDPDGVSWTPGLNVRALALDPRPGSRAALIGGNPVGSGAGLFRTDDRHAAGEGAAWRPPVWVAEDISLDPGDFVVALAYADLADGSAPMAYALTARAVVYRLDDATRSGTWRRRGNWWGADPVCIASNPFDRERVYLVTLGGGLARSIDGGGTWQAMGAPGGPSPLPADTTFWRLLPHPAQARTLIAASTYGLVVSYDEGDSWRRLGSGLPAAEIRDVFVSGGRLYAATLGRGLWTYRLA